MKLLIFTAIFFGFSFATLSAQCADKTESLGTFINSSNKSPQANIDSDSDLPKVGDKGELSKSFQNTFGKSTFSGWLTIAEAEVVSVKGKTVTFKVLEEKSVVTINGQKKNHFEKGLSIKFTSVSSDKPEAYTLKHDNGKIKEKGFRRCGKLDGLVQLFDTTGALSEDIPFVNGSREGKAGRYYPNGKQQAVGTYKNNELEGVIIRYYISGDKKSEFTMHKGDEIGAYKIYYENGNLSEEGYKDDSKKQFKNVTQYYENAKKKTVIQEITDKRYEGKVELYNSDGILSESLNYKKGELHGLCKQYTANTIEVKDYKNGEILSVEIQDKKGSPTSKEVYNADKTMTYSLYHANGKLKEKGTFTAEKINLGERLSYYDNDNLKEKAIFANGKMNGVYTSFHANAKAHINGIKKNNGFDGLYTELNAEGKPAASGTYADNKKVGTWLEYNEKGKKKKVKY